MTIKEEKGLTPKQLIFLAVYEATLDLGEASRQAKIGRNTHQVWKLKSRRGDRAYLNAFAEAMKNGAINYREKATELAIEGSRKLKVSNGQPVFVWMDSEGNIYPNRRKGAKLVPHYEVEYNSSLLLTFLKAHYPEEFKDRTDINANVTNASRVTLYLPANEPRDDDSPTSGTAGEVPGQ